jgi:hypothetical protein
MHITTKPRENSVLQKHKKGFVVLYICITSPGEKMRYRTKKKEKEIKRASHKVRS